MRYVFSARATGAGSTTLPLASVYAPAGNGGRIREIGVFNTTATAVALAVRRLTTVGTRGAAITAGLIESSLGTGTVTLTGAQAHSAVPTLGNRVRNGSLGAQIGAGIIWTFGGAGLVIPAGTTNGVGIIVETGTGQIVDFYFECEE